jgi:hypothetical protein
MAECENVRNDLPDNLHIFTFTYSQYFETHFIAPQAKRSKLPAKKHHIFPSKNPSCLRMSLTIFSRTGAISKLWSVDSTLSTKK